MPVLLIAGGLALGACGGGASTSPSAAPSQAASAAPSAAAPSAAASAELAEICTAPPKQDGVTLAFTSYGGAYQEAQRKGWLEPYSQLTGVKFVEDEGTDYAKIKAMVDSGQVTWDVVDVGNDFGLDAHADLLEPLDYTLIPQAEILPGFATTYRVGDITYGVVLAYNTDKTGGQAPAGWADYFDLTKFPGKRGTWDYSEGGIFETALLADGVPPGDLYPLDLDRAIKKLDTIKSEIVFWPGGAASQEQIGSGEVAMSLMWNGRAWSAKNVDNKPVEIQWNQQIVTADYLVIPKGSPNKDAAMNFIAWTTCANNNAAPSNYIPYGPTNVNAVANPDKVADLSVTNADENSAYFDDSWLVDNYAMVDEAYQNWKTK
ncbi:MAG TPA: ABC transporter substrate-binding protein [Candidatus Limnocylindrales bacterium]|nr:ABC transporter substrate-binding protein [Candidatus Limnocylindrales bacterium]